MPQNEQHQTELAVLGFIMANERAPYLAGDVFGICPVAAFQHADTRAMAEAVAALAARGDDPDILGVVTELRVAGRLALIGGASVVAEVAAAHGGDIWTESGLTEAVLRLVAEQRKREAHPALAAAVRAAQTPGVPPGDIAEAMRRTADALEAPGGEAGMPFDRQIDEYAAALAAPERALRPVKTPWRRVNAILRGGILPGEMAVLAARPSVGKSAFALNMAWSVACSGKKSLLFSLEMPRQQLLDRLAAAVGGIDVGRFREGLDEKERATALAATDAMRGKPFVLCDDTRVTAADVRRRIRMEQRGNAQVGLAVVDYLQLLTPGEKNPSREREVAAMSRALKHTAVELRVPVLVLAQLNRKSEEAGRPPMLCDLRESGAIEQDADIVMFLHQARTAWHADEPVKIIVAKGRSSGVGQEHLLFRRRRQQFVDADEATFQRAAREEAAEDIGDFARRQADLPW